MIARTVPVSNLQNNLLNNVLTPKEHDPPPLRPHHRLRPVVDHECMPMPAKHDLCPISSDLAQTHHDRNVDLATGVDIGHRILSECAPLFLLAMTFLVNAYVVFEPIFLKSLKKIQILVTLFDQLPFHSRWSCDDRYVLVVVYLGFESAGRGILELSDHHCMPVEEYFRS